jgi:hypothetical protein
MIEVQYQQDRATRSKADGDRRCDVVPTGAEVVGTVLEANQSGRVKGRASIAFRFDRLSAHSETHDIQTARIARQAAATRQEDAKKIGIGAGAGALIGAIAGRREPPSEEALAPGWRGHRDGHTRRRGPAGGGRAHQHHASNRGDCESSR